MLTHDLGQILKRRSTLVDDFVEGVRRPDRADDDLVLPVRQPFVGLLGKYVEGHAHFAANVFSQVVV